VSVRRSRSNSGARDFPIESRLDSASFLKDPPMLRRTTRLVLGLACLFGPALARADLLQLANGDRLQGRLIARSAGQIHWENPILGTLVVPETQATILPSDISAALPAPATQQTSVTTTATAQAPSANAPSSPTKTRWKSTIESGLAIQSGRSDRADLNFRFETSLQRRRNSYRALARYLYSKADGSVTTDRTEAAFRWRRELDQRWFGQSNSSYLAARIKGIDHNIEQNLGLGYRLIKTPRTTASLGAGFTGQYREIHDADTGQSLFGEIFQDFAIKLTPRLDLGQDFTAQYSPSGRGIRILPNNQVQIIDTAVTNYKLTLNAFLKGKITDTLSLALRYEFEYDNTYVSDSEKADQRITTTLGYSF
jgi:putative salt-induced outer membrane protein YdiY